MTSTCIENRSRIALKKNRVDLWLFENRNLKDLDLSGVNCALLSQDELQRLSNYKNKYRQLQFALSRTALRTYLSYYLPSILPQDIQFEFNQFGKPTLKNNSNKLQFNISHSKDSIIIGIARSRALGVDIECLKARPNLYEIGSQFFHKNEWNTDLLETVNDKKQYFYKLWNLKEAYLKAQGSGMSVALNSFYFSDLSLTLPSLRPHNPIYPDSVHAKLTFETPKADEQNKYQFFYQLIAAGYSYGLAVQQHSVNEDLSINLKKFCFDLSYEEIKV